jgi:hypothetical protein
MFYSGTHGNRGQTRYFLKRELFLSGDETRMKPVENNRFFWASRFTAPNGKILRRVRRSMRFV